MDVRRIRSDFPLLAREFHGRPFVYLDSAATSQKPTQVIEAEAEFYRNLNANVHRGVYALSEEATNAYESARERVARFLNASEPGEVVFVRGTTEAINLVAGSLGRGYLSKGDRVVTTVMEHHSNIVPWHLLRERPGIELVFADIDEEGELPVAQFERLITPSTKVVTLSHVSNVLGTVNPVREVADRARAAGALVVVDAAQSVPHRRVDVQALGADFVAFSGHKVLGPMGIGVLWGRKELLDRMDPFMGGGEMITEVHQDRVGFREAPAKFEAGTPNVAGAFALSRALDYVERVGWDELLDHDRRLAEHGYRKVQELFDGRVKIHGPRDPKHRHAVLSFSLRGVHPHDIASLLDAEGVAIRSGHHCAQPLMERLGVSALSRASPYLYNDAADLDRCFEALLKAEKVFLGTPGARPSPERAATFAPPAGARDGIHPFT